MAESRRSLTVNIHADAYLGNKLRHAVVLTTTILAANATFAHHSAIRFDRERVVPVQGSVTRYEWRSPHVYLYIEDASNVEWQLEGASPQLMARLGWSVDSFAPGDLVNVRANPDANPTNAHGLLLSAETPDGVALSSRRTGLPQSTDAVVGAPDLGGVWGGEESFVNALFAALEDHPLTDKGRIAKSEYEESMNPVVDCVAFPTPFIVAANATYVNELELGDDVILFRSEFYNAERTIYMDGREHPENGERTNQGHSIGWWEDDTLVIDTALFSESRAPFPTIGIPSGTQKHVVERYTLTEDGTRAMVETRTEDPEYLAEPLLAEFVWIYSPDLELLRFDCDLEVARRFSR